jgi:hypothetical protein
MDKFQIGNGILGTHSPGNITGDNHRILGLYQVLPIFL